MKNENFTEQNAPQEHERHVAAVTAALSILDCFTQDTSLRLKDLHDRTGMQKSRILRLAGSLASSGYLVPEPAGRYRLGPKILALGQLVTASSVGIAERIRPVLAGLSAKLGETCFFSVVRATQRMVLEQVSPSSGLCFTIPSGQLRPLHVGATGKVLLAFGADAIRARIVEGDLPALIPQTQTDRDALIADIALAQRQGYLVSRGEATAHAYALSVPVLGRDRTLLGALSVAGPSSRLAPSQESALATELQQAILDMGLSTGSVQSDEKKGIA